MAYLITNVTPDGDGHQHQLRIEAGVQDSAKVARCRGERSRHVGKIDHLLFGRIGRGCAERHGGGEVSGGRAEAASDQGWVTSSDGGSQVYVCECCTETADSSPPC